MSTFLLHLPPLTGTQVSNCWLSLPGCHFQSEAPQPWRLRRSGMSRAITMRDRSKNRKPTQRGRYLSIEGIQAVQALKRAKIYGSEEAVARAIETKIQRLVKFDLVAVLRELQSQEEAILAFQVFEELRKEHWYKPQLSAYVDMITVLAKNGFKEKVQQACSYLKMERWEPDTEGFNLLLKALLEFGFVQTAMDCFHLMKLWESEPDEITYRILINGLETSGDKDTYLAIRYEAERNLSQPLELLEQSEV